MKSVQQTTKLTTPFIGVAQVSKYVVVVLDVDSKLGGVQRDLISAFPTVFEAVGPKHAVRLALEKHSDFSAGPAYGIDIEAEFTDPAKWVDVASSVQEKLPVQFYGADAIYRWEIGGDDKSYHMITYYVAFEIDESGTVIEPWKKLSRNR